MIVNLLKNLLIGLVLNAGAALAFGVRDEPAAAALAAVPQGCLAPIAAIAESAQPSTLADTDAHS